MNHRCSYTVDFELTTSSARSTKEFISCIYSDVLKFDELNVFGYQFYELAKIRFWDDRRSVALSVQGKEVHNLINLLIFQYKIKKR